MPTMFEKYTLKAGIPISAMKEPFCVTVAEVHAAIEMAAEGRVPDGSCSDAMCTIWSAVLGACRRNPGGKF